VRHASLRAMRLFAGYAAALVAVVMAGYLNAAVGLWAAIPWGCGLLVSALYVKRRRATRNSGQ
jgi:hypothetical protein